MHDAKGLAGAARRHCFDVARLRDADAAAACAVTMAERPALALAALLPVLGCGEEAAGMAFDGLAGRRDAGIVSTTLHIVADEERVHDALLRQLQNGLPEVARNEAMLRAARRFHIGLTRGGPVLHLARIAALDAAVCTILARLLRVGGPVAADPAVAKMLRRIHRDETRHVRLTRRLAIDAAPDGMVRDAAARARYGLAELLTYAGAAFEGLGVDPARLDRDIRRLPDGLLTA